MNPPIAVVEGNLRESTPKLWGHEVTFVNNLEAGYCGKMLVVNPGFKSSLHYHRVKTETFLMLDGTLVVEVPGSGGPHLLRGWAQDTLTLPAGTPHRFWSADPETIACFIEFSTPHSDEDTVRLELSREIE